MAGKNDGGDKTEQPTPKRLADARKKGDVPKSRDVTSTVVLFVWLIVLMFGAGYAGREIIGLFDGSFVLIGGDVPFPIAVRELGRLTGVETPFTDALFGLARLQARQRGLY